MGIGGRSSGRNYERGWGVEWGSEVGVKSVEKSYLWWRNGLMSEHNESQGGRALEGLNEGTSRRTANSYGAAQCSAGAGAAGAGMVIGCVGVGGPARGEERVARLGTRLGCGKTFARTLVDNYGNRPEFRGMVDLDLHPRAANVRMGDAEPLECVPNTAVDGSGRTRSRIGWSRPCQLTRSPSWA